jgi:sulfur carrier protein ThiS
VRQEAVVVMHGEKIYRRGEIPDVPVQHNDVIEIVKMTQGG